MEQINDIKAEIQIVKFFGFNVSKSDNNNYIITDVKGNQVGFIKSKMEDLSHDQYPYYTQIDNDELFVESGDKTVAFSYSQPTFSIYYKKTGTHVTVHTGSDFTALRIHQFDTHPGNKILMIYIDQNEFNFISQEPYDWYLTQYVQVNLVEKLYSYNISFKDMTDREHNYPYYNGDLQCKINKENASLISIKNTWEFWRGKSCKNHNNDYISIVKGTMREVILKHQMGITAFNRMRYLVNVVPFKNDIIDFLIQNAEFKLPNYLDLFIPEIKNQKGTKKLFK